MEELSLRTYINIVNGIMTGLDRKKKRVIINGSSFIDYDYLFLMCGTQFQTPIVATRKKKKKQLAFPQNVFIINGTLDSNKALIKLQDLTEFVEDCK